jgi:S-formylglutathione hydrolase FrmB
MRNTATVPACLGLALMIGVWGLGAESRNAKFEAEGPKPDKTGIPAYFLRSPYQRGPNALQFLLPEKLEQGKRYPVLYILPVYAGGDAKASGIHEAKRLDLHNRHGLICVAPTFDRVPWYADHPSDPQVRQESYMLDVVLPFVEQTFPAAREPGGRLLVGFSKSGWGAFGLLLRHPEVFGRAASWDAPLMMQKIGLYETPQVLATQENFERYKVLSLLEKRAKLLSSGPARLVLLGHGNFSDDGPLHRKMTEWGIRHDYDHGPKRAHAWDSGWLGPAVEALLRPAGGTTGPRG